MKFAVARTRVGWAGIGIDDGTICHIVIDADKGAALRRIVAQGATEPASRAEASGPIDLVKRAAAGEDVRVNGQVKLVTGSKFQQAVWLALLQIPHGTTISYAEMARRVGKPGAARAVGQALGSNPVPLVLPCHRVIAADGTIGGYGGGLPMKHALLKREGVML